MTASENNYMVKQESLHISSEFSIGLAVYFERLWGFGSVNYYQGSLPLLCLAAIQ